ncbi:Cilia- and flagella-associated protein 43 [Amphibalanus amphitrite]|uniref:Cilia- and flagella-associated protein 43 n=1 Tax=Amphibalanus amphitrite TaxID=1232801 RepID=A0A6A4VDQ0_AMPAM|nr:Cilia- and flagella-associated protein 43 [Amphibalanus amphitrite]
MASPAVYMDEATVASLCGMHVRFTCAGMSHKDTFSPKARGVSTLATNGSDLFAVSEVCLRPAVIVYQYPELVDHARLEDGAELEYLFVAFSPSSERVAAFSGVPDFTVFLWDISSQVMIAKLPIGFAQAPQLSFCDLDTPHLALTSEVGVNVIQMEHFGSEWRLTPRTANLDSVRSHTWDYNGDLCCSRRERIYLVSLDTMEHAELQLVNEWIAGTIVSIVYNAKGIFAAMDDGRILLVERCGASDTWSSRVIDELGLSVLIMRPSPSFNFLAVTCRTGQVLLLYTPSHDYKALEGYEFESPPAVDACLLAPQFDHVVSIHAPHELHVWTASHGKHQSSVQLTGWVTCIASLDQVPCVMVGTQESCLVVIDLVLPLTPRVIWHARICEAAVKSITGLGVLTQLEMDGTPVAVQTYQRSGCGWPEDVLVFLCTSKAELLSLVRVILVRDREVFGAVTYGLDTVYTGLALHVTAPLDRHDDGVNPLVKIFTMAITDRSLCSFTLRDHDDLLEQQVSDLLWRPEAAVPSGHELRDVRLQTVGQYLLSVGDDGLIRGRSDRLDPQEANTLLGKQWRQIHQAISGGTRSIVVNHSVEREVVTVGRDGTIIYLKLPYGGRSTGRRRRSSFFVEEAVPEARFVSKMPALSRMDLMSNPPTWREEQAEMAWRSQEKELLATRDKVRVGVELLRAKVKMMLDENAEMEEIDRLPENEFELDLDEQARLQEESEARVQKARAEIIDQNARNAYIRDQIKKQCWDSMDVKGKAIQGMMVELEVSNYPLLARSDDCRIVLEGIQERRQLELTEMALHNEMFEHSSTTAQRPSIAPEPLLAATASHQEGADSAEEPAGHGTPVADEEPEYPDSEDGVVQQDTTHTGSISHQLGVTSPWLLSQFCITSRKQRVEQIYMLREVIYQLKMKFNERFEVLYNSKCSEVQRITAWAERLRHIYSELGMSETPWVPRWSAAEQPESLLTVSDDEVTVERYLTPAERARLEARAAEEERRRREREANDFRERAIQQMMNGVLEVRWEDTLKIDVPKPPFMDEKDPGEWSDEEIKAAAEYERKVVALEEERDKYRKMLEQELKKLLVSVQETVDKFDDQLNQLFVLKVRTQHAIDQEQLKVDRLLRDVAEEDHRVKRETELCRQMDATQQRKVALQAASADLRRALETARAAHEPLVQQEKLMERSFRKEFPDTPTPVVDVLFRYFRRRPQVLRRYLDATFRRATVVDEGVIEVEHSRRRHSRRRSRHGSRSPAASNRADSTSKEVPQTEEQQQRKGRAAKIAYLSATHAGTPYEENKKTVPGQRVILEAMKTIDDDSQRSADIDLPLWQKMCQLRLAKVLVEFKVLESNAQLAVLVDSIEKRRHAEEALTLTTQSLVAELAELREQRLRQLHDQEIQLVLKQGQVEIDLGDFCPDFTGSALIHRSKVEQLNKQILSIGGKKLEVMRDALRFRRGIVLQRWEYDRCRMMLEDLVNKLKDIDFMKVTRAIQMYLVQGGDTTEKQIARLEKRLDMLIEDAVRQQKEDADAAEYLERLLRMKRADNQRLALEARELNVDVSERELIYDIRCNHQRRWQARERLNNLRKIRDLCDIAGFQQRYMAMLHRELQRVYSKTYPMLHAI